MFHNLISQVYTFAWKTQFLTSALRELGGEAREEKLENFQIKLTPQCISSTLLLWPLVN